MVQDAAFFLPCEELWKVTIQNVSCLKIMFIRSWFSRSRWLVDWSVVCLVVVPVRVRLLCDVSCSCCRRSSPSVVVVSAVRVVPIGLRSLAVLCALVVGCEVVCVVPVVAVSSRPFLLLVVLSDRGCRLSPIVLCVVQGASSLLPLLVVSCWLYCVECCPSCCW